LKCNKHAAEPVLEAVLFVTPSRFHGASRRNIGHEPRESAKWQVSARSAVIEGATHAKAGADQPTLHSGLRARLTHLLMVPIKDYREQRGGQNIEYNNIDVRMSFDQGEH
jgi:hypothetical protein